MAVEHVNAEYSVARLELGYRLADGLDVASKLDAENPLVLFRLGSLLLDLGRHKEARTVLEHAARNTPANAPETFKSGVIRRLEQCR